MLYRRAAGVHVRGARTSQSLCNRAWKSILIRSRLYGVTVRVVSIGGGGGGGSYLDYLDEKLKREKQRQLEAERRMEEASEKGLAADQVMQLEAELEAATLAVADAGQELAEYYSKSVTSFWHGDGAQRLGLSGRVEKEDLAAVYEGVDPSSGERLGRKFGESSVRGFDATFAVPKEVSILWADADVATRVEIEKAVVDAAKAVLDDVVGARAATRMRTAGPGEWLAEDRSPVRVNAEGPAIAVIPEFTSRAGDPHMHVHSVISSKVYEPMSERFLALDARTLVMEQQAMSGMFAVGLEAELYIRLGVDWGGRVTRFSRGINGIDRDLVDVFSTRHQQTKDGLAERSERFEEAMGHAPTPQQAYRLQVQAQRETRASKDPEQLLFDEWQTRISEHTGLERGELARRVVGRDDPASIDSWPTVETRISAAVKELVDQKSSFTRGDLMAEIARVQPVGAYATNAVEAIQKINAETDQALETFGREVTVAGTDEPVRKYTTDEVLEQEIRIFTHLETASSKHVPANPAVIDHAPDYLDSLQLQAAGRAASTSGFEMVEGLAGAGKTSTLKTAVDTLEAQDREAFGLAPSSIAADVLASETGMSTDNISKFLWEHTERDNGPSDKFDLSPGSTLFVDEAGMVSTPHWAQLTELAASHDWRIVAVGDPYQFSAVGRGGVFAHALATLPSHRISRLEQVHRFNNDWEGQASAGIRAGDHQALDPYFAHGRIHTIDPDAQGSMGDVIARAVARYRIHQVQGHDVALFATTNDTVDQLNHTVQLLRANNGDLGEQIPGINKRLHVGDQIETRRNDRDLVTDRGRYVKNRDRWTITEHTQNGVTVKGASGTVTLPHDYINDHVNLAYAQTAHASQGRTIDGVAITVIDPDGPALDRAGLYVPLTRGKHANEVFLQAANDTAARQILEDALDRRWIDAPAISHIQTQPTQQPAPDPVVQPEPQVEQLQLQLDTARKIVDPGPRRSRAVPPDPEYHQPSLIQEPAPPEQPLQLDIDTASPPPPATQVFVPPTKQILPKGTQPAPTPPDATLPPNELADHVMTVITLGPVAVETAQKELERNTRTHNETIAKYKAIDAEYDQLLETRNTLAENPPPLWKPIKPWENTLTGYDQTLDRLNQTRNDLADQAASLKNDRKFWTQYVTPQARQQYKHAQTVVANDQLAHGHNQLTNPDVIARLGQPPTNPQARHAWQTAAGAISQRSLFAQHQDHDNPNHYSINRHLKHAVTTTTKELGQHVGPENVPALQGPSAGRGLSL